MALNRHPRPDPSTTDRLLAGRIGPDDAPPGYRRVADLLGAAGSGLSEPAGPVDGALVGAMVNAIQAAPPAPAVSERKPMLRKILAVKTIAVVSVLALSASGAAAATGNLPDAVQDKVANAAKHIGVNLPEGKGVARVTETCPAGQTFKNRGQYLKWVRENNPEGLEAAKTSTCGMPVTSKGTPGADEPDEAPETPAATENNGQAGEDHGKAEQHENPGQAGEDHGKAEQHENPGKAGEDHGKAEQHENPGKAGEDHGKAGQHENPGKAGEDHGKPGEKPGAEDLPLPVPLPSS